MDLLDVNGLIDGLGGAGLRHVIGFFAYAASSGSTNTNRGAAGGSDARLLRPPELPPGDQDLEPRRGPGQNVRHRGRPLAVNRDQLRALGWH